MCMNASMFLWPLLQKPPEDETLQKKLKNEPSSVTAETLARLQVVDFAGARATELQCLLMAVAGKEMGKRTSFPIT